VSKDYVGIIYKYGWFIYIIMYYDIWQIINIEKKQKRAQN